jgi:hypothetical protein
MPSIPRRLYVLAQSNAEFVGEDFDHVLRADLVSADEHMVVLALADGWGYGGPAGCCRCIALPLHEQHGGEQSGVHQGSNGAGSRASVSASGSQEARHPSVVKPSRTSQLWRTTQRVGEPVRHWR